MLQEQGPAASKHLAAFYRFAGAGPVAPRDRLAYFLLADLPLVSLRPVLGGETGFLAPVRTDFAGLGDGFFVAIVLLS